MGTAPQKQKRPADTDNSRAQLQLTFPKLRSYYITIARLSNSVEPETLFSRPSEHRLNHEPGGTPPQNTPVGRGKGLNPPADAAIKRFRSADTSPAPRERLAGPTPAIPAWR